MSRTLARADIEKLSIMERLELIGDIWDSISESDVATGIPDWHVRVLQQRRAAADAEPEAGAPWEEVRARLMTPR